MSDTYGFPFKVSPTLRAARRHAIKEFSPLKKVIEEGKHRSIVGSFRAENKQRTPQKR